MMIGIKSGRIRIVKSELVALADKVRAEPKLTKKLIMIVAIVATISKLIIKLLSSFNNKAMIGKIIISGKEFESQLAIVLAKTITSKT